MNIVKLGDDLTEIEGRVRVERGYLRRRAVATPELLSDDLTARHYRTPIERQAHSADRKVVVGGAEYVIGPPRGNAILSEGEPVMVLQHFVDAKGAPIRIGEEFDYLDYRSPERVWYVYRKEAVEGRTGDVFVLKGDRPDYEAALALGVELSQEA